MPSQEVDPADLHGVFDKSDPTPSATARATAATSGSDRIEPGLPVRERASVAGPCIERRGAPTKDLGRIARRPACRRARVFEDRDREGTPRYGCVFSPSGYRDRLPLPLVVFFHNEVDNPTAIHRRTRLRKRYGKLDLSGDPERPGFLILAPQARRIGHLLRFDTDYTAADNVDIETVDKFIDKLVAAGEVDSERIYAIGEARGGEMAALYAMVRSDRIAAFATFATDASPFRWNCAGTGPPAAILYRACDVD